MERAARNAAVEWRLGVQPGLGLSFDPASRVSAVAGTFFCHTDAARPLIQTRRRTFEVRARERIRVQARGGKRTRRSAVRERPRMQVRRGAVFRLQG